MNVSFDIPMLKGIGQPAVACRKPQECNELVWWLFFELVILRLCLSSV